MAKPNSEYLRQSEFCRKMAEQAKLPDLKRAWLELAACWHALAKSPPGSFDVGKPVVRASAPAPVPGLHLKRPARF